MKNKQSTKSKSFTNLPTISVLGSNPLSTKNNTINKTIQNFNSSSNNDNKNKNAQNTTNKSNISNLETTSKFLNPNTTNEISPKESNDQIPHFIQQEIKQLSKVKQQPVYSETRFLEKVDQTQQKNKVSFDPSFNTSQNFMKFLDFQDSVIYVNSKEAMIRMRKTSQNNIKEKLNKLWIQDKKNFQTSLNEIQKKILTSNDQNFNTNVRVSQSEFLYQEPEYQQKFKVIPNFNTKSSMGGFTSTNTFLKKSYNSSNRKEVIELEEWMNFMIQNLKKESMNSNNKEISIQIQLIYSVCIKELIQQCSSECNERGRLLGRIWGYYIDLLQQITQKQEEGIGATEQLQLDEVTRLHKTYGQMVELLRQEVKKVKFEGEDTRQLSEQLIQTNQFLKNKLLQSTSEIKNLLINLDDLKIENEKLLKEIIDSRTLQPTSKDGGQSNNQFESKQIENPSSNSKSIVQHILNFKQSLLMRERPKVEKQHASQIQIYEKLQKNENQLKEELLERGIIGIEEMNKTYSAKNMLYSENMDVVSTQIQTDPFVFSENPQVNELIYSLADCRQFLDHYKSEETTNEKEIYGEAIRKIEENHYISHDDKIFFVKILKQALNQLHNYQVLVDNFSSVNDQYAKTRKKAVNNLIELKEQQQLVDELRQDLIGTSKLIEGLQEAKKVLKKSKTFNNSELSKRFNQIIRRASVGIAFSKAIQDKEQPKLQDSQSQLSNQSPARNIYKKSNFAVPPRARVSIEMNLMKGNSQNIDDEQNPKEVFNQDQSRQETLQEEESRKINEEEQHSENSSADEDQEELVDKVNIDGFEFDEASKFDIKTFQEYLKFKQDRILKEKTKRYSINTQQSEPKTSKIKRYFSQNTDSANQLLSFIIDKNVNRNFKKNKRENISLNQIIKIVNTVYIEALKSEDGYRIPLHIGIYDLLINRYGFKKVAEKKHRQILSFIIRHQNENFKLTLLAQLCHLVGSIDQQAYKLFLLSYQRLCSKIKHENLIETIIPYEQVNEYLHNFLCTKLDQKQLQGLQLRMKQIMKGNNVDFDQLMLSIIHIYLTKKEENEHFLKVLFQAADLNGNNLIEFQEFKLIFSLVYPEKFNKKQILQIFLNYADIFDEQTKDKMMTLQRFAEMAFEQNLFQKEQIQIAQEGYEKLKEIWNEEKDIIKYRFLVAGKFNKVKHTFELLSNFINDGSSSSSQQSLQIGYKLLETKSREVILKHESQEIFYQLLPTDLLWIQESYKVYQGFEF